MTAHRPARLREHGPDQRPHGYRIKKDHRPWDRAQREPESTSVPAEEAAVADVPDLRYIAGNEYIEITRTERGFIDTINRLYRGNGAQLGWTLLGDAFSGALIVLALSGVLLCSRMDGSRLLAIGLGGAGLLSALYFGLAGA